MTTATPAKLRDVDPLKLVPFNEVWITHDKLDVKAIYRRPRYREDEYGELYREVDDKGLPTWDLTGPLPVKQHNRWRTKGFEYVTLADRESLAIAGTKGTIEGDWRQYNQHQVGGPWNYKRYAAGQISEATAVLKQLEEDCYAFGSEVVETIRRRIDPGFQLPPTMQGIKAGAKRRDKDEKAPEAAAAGAAGATK